MKKINLVFLLAYIVVLAFGYPFQEQESLRDEELYEELLVRTRYMDCSQVCYPILEPTKMEYTLFTRSNPKIGQIIEAKNSESIKKSNFNSKHNTRFVIHGWNSSPTASFSTAIIEALLAKEDFNIFAVDWTACAKTINYFQARCCVSDIGKQIAEFIDYLNVKHSLKFRQITLIGHSLGAHCAGHAGKMVKKGKIHTIIGLDPAKPCFIHENTDDRLAEHDAEYVETIHTNGGYLGFYEPVGKASFYPNMGTWQPGCSMISPNTCAHGRSHQYFVESIVQNNFIPMKCKDFEAFKNKECDIVAEKGVKMGGEPSNHGKASGIYYLETNNKAPFGIGQS